MKNNQQYSNFVKKIASIYLIGIALTNPSFAYNNVGAVFDPLLRLISYPGKIEVPCPSQDKNTAVLLAIGQSNVANHGEIKFSTQYPTQVFNYFNGKCYVASSPLLGASGERGEFLTPLADYLIEGGIYNKVIIIASGINGSQISRWTPNFDLNPMLMSVLAEVKSKYKITEIIWHQGETDFLIPTPKDNYLASFYSFLSTIRINTTLPPIYYAIATHCGPNWYFNNPVALAQYSLTNEQNNIFLGANTDALIPMKERFDNACHFRYIGQLKAAFAYAQAIQQNKPFYAENNQ
ncbi:MAG: hypothetical protein H0U73_01125 [Tatlockia sp.]|nr:hypothetical protein [Tatlockia sp.]